MTNNCVFNCAYCSCPAAGRDKSHLYTVPPRELARLAVDCAARNGRGVFCDFGYLQKSGHNAGDARRVRSHNARSLGIEGLSTAKSCRAPTRL